MQVEASGVSLGQNYTSRAAGVGDNLQVPYGRLIACCANHKLCASTLRPFHNSAG